VKARGGDGGRGGAKMQVIAALMQLLERRRRRICFRLIAMLWVDDAEARVTTVAARRAAY